jgi:hypothetical protein
MHLLGFSTDINRSYLSQETLQAICPLHVVINEKLWFWAKNTAT